jgi:hypothetical protein
MSHTPGPWNFSWEIQPNGCPTVGHNGLMVCMVAHSAKDPSQKATALANASLISAAPTMLEALEDLLSAYKSVMHSEFDTPGQDWVAEDDVAASAAINAITKARGLK